jgi:hypothetical protein
MPWIGHVKTPKKKDEEKKKEKKISRINFNKFNKFNKRSEPSLYQCINVSILPTNATHMPRLSRTLFHLFQRRASFPSVRHHRLEHHRGSASFCTTPTQRRWFRTLVPTAGRPICPRRQLQRKIEQQ